MLKYTFNLQLSIDELMKVVDFLDSGVEEQIQKGASLSIKIGDRTIFIAKSSEGAVVYEDIRDTIKYKMKVLNITQATLAEYLGISRQAVNNIFKSDRQVPKKYLEEICNILGIERH